MKLLLRCSSLVIYLFEWQDEVDDALLAAELSEQLVRVGAFAVAGLHHLWNDSSDVLLLGYGSKQLVVEDLRTEWANKNVQLFQNYDWQRNTEGAIYRDEHVHAWVKIPCVQRWFQDRKQIVHCEGQNMDL